MNEQRERELHIRILQFDQLAMEEWASDETLSGLAHGVFIKARRALGSKDNERDEIDAELRWPAIAARTVRQAQAGAIELGDLNRYAVGAMKRAGGERLASDTLSEETHAARQEVRPDWIWTNSAPFARQGAPDLERQERRIERLLACIAQMSENDQQLVALHLVSASIADIAELRGTSENAISQARRRALERLRSCLTDDAITDEELDRVVSRLSATELATAFGTESPRRNRTSSSAPDPARLVQIERVLAAGAPDRKLQWRLSNQVQATLAGLVPDLVANSVSRGDLTQLLGHKPEDVALDADRQQVSRSRLALAIGLLAGAQDWYQAAAGLDARSSRPASTEVASWLGAFISAPGVRKK
jgi:hypothetical protein